MTMAERPVEVGMSATFIRFLAGGLVALGHFSLALLFAVFLVVSAVAQ